MLPVQASVATARRAEARLRSLANDEAQGTGTILVVRNDDVVAEVVQRSSECDLRVLGLRRVDGRPVFGEVMMRSRPSVWAEAGEAPTDRQPGPRRLA